MELNFEILSRASKADGLLCFVIARNEIYFLPHLLRHYRALGVGHFIFYDDGSTDGSREFLAGQDDCTVMTSEYAFEAELIGKRQFQYMVRTMVPRHYADGGWALVVDADEFLFLPKRFNTIQDVIAHLEAAEQICALAPMVDFYPERLELRNYDRRLGPFAGPQWWFDAEAGFERTPNSPFVTPLPRGIRVRLSNMLFTKHPEAYHDVYAELEGKRSYAKLWKVPLVKTGAGIVRLNSHSVNVQAAPDVQLALAHFKFFPGIDEKLHDLLGTKGHRRYAREYRFMRAALDHLSQESLIGPVSRRFDGPASLEAAGLMFG